MHLNGFRHPGPTSTSHLLENVLMSRYSGSWCELPHLIAWQLRSQGLFPGLGAGPPSQGKDPGNEVG